MTFDVDTAGVVIDGTSAAASELRLGMVVEVRGTVDARTAAAAGDVIEARGFVDGDEGEEVEFR